MEFFVNTLQHWIQAAGGFGVFFASLAEEAISLIPSSAVQTGAGVFIMAGESFGFAGILKLILQVSIPSAIGVTLGSLPYVWLARKYGIKIIERWGKWIGVTLDDLHKLESKFSKTAWDDLLFVGMRAFPVIPSIALAIYGGIIEMSWKQYIVLSFLGVFIRATALGAVGWLFGNGVRSATSRVEFFEMFGLIVALVLLVSFLFWNKKQAKSQAS